MKKFLILLSMLFCFTAYAQTETLNWYMDGQTYATTTCESGNDILLPTTPTKRGYTFKGWAEYIPIEYLESTGTQYIDTGYKPNDNTRMKITYIFTGTYGNIFGTRNSVNNAAFSIAYPPSQNALLLDYGSERDESVTKAPWSNTLIAVDFNKNILYMDNLSTGITYTKTFTIQTFHANYNQILFGFNNLGIIAPALAIIYSCKLYDNDVLVRDFIPVLDGNGTPCMYDKVTKQFFYNQGTGQFIAGPIIGSGE